MHGLILLLFLFSLPVPPIDSSTWYAGLLEYEIRVIVIWVITHNVWTWSQSSHRASGHNWPPAVCAGLRGHILARNLHFPQYYFAKFYKVSAVQYHIEYLFLQPKFDLGSVTSRDWNCPKLWKSFTIFILSSPCVIRPSVLPSALLAWYQRTLGHPQLCARAGISLYPVSAPRLSVTRAAVSVRSPDQAVGGTTCDPSPYIVKNI